MTPACYVLTENPTLRHLPVVSDGLVGTQPGTVDVILSSLNTMTSVGFLCIECYSVVSWL